MIFYHDNLQQDVVVKIELLISEAKGGEPESEKPKYEVRLLLADETKWGLMVENETEKVRNCKRKGWFPLAISKDGDKIQELGGGFLYKYPHM
jgi:hypothetical protein